MELIVWNNERFSVNIKQFDEHHKKIVNFINILHSAMMEGKGKSVLSPILNELSEYVKYHFRAEEKLMEMYHCETINNHKQQHHDFEIKVAQLIKEYDTGCLTTSIDTLSFLKSWFFEHILMEDKLYSHCFNAKGIY